MPLKADELARRRAHFWTRTAQYRSEGYDRIAGPSILLDEAGALDGPVLDVGTGMGITARELARRGPDVVSVDTNADDQEVAAFLTGEEGLASRVRFVLADASALPFPDHHFGSAVAFDVLHHLGSGPPVLTELLRVVRPGGLLVLADFTREGFEVVSRVHAAEGRVHAEGPVTVDWTRGFLCALGLTERRVSDGRLHRLSVMQTPDIAQAPAAFAALDRGGLLKALGVFAANWLAHDGCWFLAAEERLGMDTAMELDAASWRRFAAAEAWRIMDAFACPRGGGLESLRRALAYRMYSFINPWHTETSPSGDVLRFFMDACRVQETRRRKGLADFPCRAVGQVEFETFARTVDPRIRTICLHCPPDPDAGGHCGWEFRVVADEPSPHPVTPEHR
jgi:SAM-dependent methyltransferase